MAATPPALLTDQIILNLEIFYWLAHLYLTSSTDRQYSKHYIYTIIKIQEKLRGSIFLGTSIFLLSNRNPVNSSADPNRHQCVMAHASSWKGLNDASTAVTEVFQGNEDPLCRYHTLYSKQDRSSVVQYSTRNTSAHRRKRRNFYSHGESKTATGKSKELNGECKVVKTGKVLRQPP